MSDEFQAAVFARLDALMAVQTDILDQLRKLEGLSTQVDTLIERQTGIATAVKHWADETMALHSRYQDALKEIGALSERVARLERRTHGSSPGFPAPGNGQ